MSVQPAAGRDVLSELDSIRDFLLGLCGENPLPGLEANAKDLAARFIHLRDLAQNTVELAGAYASGVTHADRVRRSMGLSDDEQSEVARLREENAQLLARMQTGAESQGGPA